MGKMIDRGREIFGLAPVKDALDKLRAEVEALGKALEAARRKREDLAHSPVSKSELVKTALANGLIHSARNTPAVLPNASETAMHRDRWTSIRSLVAITR